MSQLRPSFRFIAVSFLVLLPLVLAQQDPASCTVSCRFVVVPTVGPPGLNGTVGAQGPIGPIGATGQTGAQGAQGVMGPAGAKGDKGDKGDTGATGQTGSQGVQGIQGPKGDKGDTGATGQTGLQGPKGDTGVFDTSVITASVIKESETHGHFRMKNWGSLGISDPTDNSNGYTMINVTIAGSLVTTNTELFYPSHTGSVLEWSDGAAAVIQTVGPLGAAGSTTFTAARPFNFPRAWQMVKFWIGNTMLSNNFAVFQDKIALKAVIGTAGSALTIDVTKMRVDANVRHQTSWTFPHPGPAGQQNYFVGEETVQTLKNKVLASPSITGVVGGAPIFPTLVASPDTTGWTNCVGTTDGLGKVTFGTGTRVNMADIGSLIRWADGTSSMLIDTPGQSSAIGTVDDSTVRTNVACAIFGPNNAFFTGKQYLSMGSPIFHSTNANRVAFLSLASMALNTKATYLLPPISGAGQTTMASDTLVAASTAQTLSNKVLNSPLVDSNSITGQLNGLPCTGSTLETRINLVVSGTEGGGFGWRDIGSAVKWADGTTSIIADAPSGSVPGDRWRYDGRIYDTVVRTNMACTFYEAISQTIASNSHLSSPGTLSLHAGSAVVTISNEKSNNRVRETWFFPPVIAGTYRNDTFVGEAAPQTLTNKVLNMPNPTAAGAAASTSLDYYEYAQMSVSLSGHFTATNAVTLRFTRIGRQVSCAVTQYLAAAGATANVITVAPGIMPTRFRPLEPMHFSTPGYVLNQRPFICLEVHATGEIKFWGGVCGANFPTGTGSSGWSATTLHWIVP